MAGIDVALALVGVVLEELLAGLGVTHTSEDTEFREVQIADGSAGILFGGTGINVD